ncbi:glycine betaine ABC transporter substrate-binding protein [Halomicrococcus gelatinilyticus]|uniref:glycine betaine ABC transporter substrate-binding protein n=1 Tax=Halomicrococcus gelatinilyticus TaxID=1702103 RepID=UPI002E106749
MSDQLTRRSVLKRGSGAAGAAGLGSLAGCLGGIMGSGSAVTVGSKQFTEQKLLGHLSTTTLKENTDVDVKSKVGLGGTVTNFEALKNGDITFYWEYTGTMWATLPPKHDEVITDPQTIYDKVGKEFKSEYDLELLDRAPFNNTYVLAGNADWVDKTGVKTLSDFAKYVKNGNTDFKLVMDAEFQEREDGWPGLTEHYGFGDAAKNLNVKTVNPSLGYQIAGEGEAALTMGFNTNPQIIKYDLQVLEDDEKFFPVYNPAPVVRSKALKDASAIEKPLNDLAAALDTETIRGLNKKVSIDEKESKTVAEDFLTENGLI